jgi:Zn-dependent protease
VIDIVQGVLAAVAAVLAITLHEAAHGFAALAMGDDTAKKLGRLSLNPIRHIDRMGTIIVPGFLILSQLATIHRVAFMFGWAKPVPVAAWKFSNPRRGMMVVAAAGPAMNFLLAWLGALALYAEPHLPDQWAPYFVDFIISFMAYNLLLGLFNLLPIPPLDGGRIAVGLLPVKAAMAYAKLERAGIALVLIVGFLLPEFLRDVAHIDFNPVNEALGSLLPRALHLVLMLAGQDG